MKTTTFSSNRAVQRHYDNTIYKYSIVWIEEKTKRIRSILCAVFIPIIMGLLVLLFDKEETGYALVQSVMIAVMLPCVFFVPIAILRYKNDRIASLPAGACRYGDTLVFTQDHILYTYKNRLETMPRHQHEHVIFYDSIQQAIVYRKLQTLMVLAGGIDTDYNADGSIRRRKEYRTSVDKRQSARWIDIPLTYTNNDAFLNTFKQKTGIKIQEKDSVIIEGDC